MQIDKLTDKEQLIRRSSADIKVDISEVIDVIIKANGFIGVGLVTLEEYVVKAIKKHHKYESLDKIMNG